MLSMSAALSPSRADIIWNLELTAQPSHHDPMARASAVFEEYNTPAAGQHAIQDRGSALMVFMGTTLSEAETITSDLRREEQEIRADMDANSGPNPPPNSTLVGRVGLDCRAAGSPL